MKLQRDETLTGILVLVAGAVAVAVIVALGAPGVIHPLKTYHVYFDNASEIQPGTEVFLAGRRVGQVTELESPVPMEARPAGHPEMETLVTVRVLKQTRIYRRVTVRMQQYGWFGQQLIDFVGGDETSGPAEPGTSFIGERLPGFPDLTVQASDALREMNGVLGNLESLTGKDGDLSRSAANAREFTDTIKREPWRLIWKSKAKKKS